jgi:large exoprotein involved in heme utilization and adhesion
MSGMTQSKWRWSWQFSVRLLVIGGAIPFAAIAPCFANGIASLHAFSGNYVLAQITPDGTLGAESSVATPNVNMKGHSADRIDGGAIRGTNLFHSFSQFNVDNGQRVY